MLHVGELGGGVIGPEESPRSWLSGWAMGKSCHCFEPYFPPGKCFRLVIRGLMHAQNVACICYLANIQEMAGPTLPSLGG